MDLGLDAHLETYPIRDGEGRYLRLQLAQHAAAAVEPGAPAGECGAIPVAGLLEGVVPQAREDDGHHPVTIRGHIVRQE